ncbi:hypothetical protein H5410_013841 [Solanum commersonii]|uniref:DUF4283 domain-containing protein n=1 Tax=Solanum commersonii TaxID=4109 RepID=A0A9J5ZPC3_SOLCO|nr:hypothetical protein H5410_013841 [Solanum commersonii]
MAVGEPNTSSNPEATYAACLNSIQTGQNLKTTKLKSIDIIHGELTITFTVEGINQYTMEEGLHQALVFKFSQDPINMQEVRKLLPIQLGTQGRCLVGWLAHRHILVRFDRYDDYILAAAKTIQHLSYNGLQKQFRVFSWTIGFNPKEKTSRAFPIVIDKATQDKSRPSTARVKVEIDLLANLPHRMRIQYGDQKTGKSVKQFQKFVYDNLPFYCNFCKHQGRNESDCRLLLGNTAARNQEEASQVGFEIEKYQGDAREILDEKRAENKSLLVDKSGVHDQVVVARDLECQNKENFRQLLGKAIAHESASGVQSLTTRNTLVLESQVDFGQQSNSNIVENKSVTGARLGVKNTREISINNEGGKTGFLQIDSKSVDDIHSSGNKVGAIEILEKKLNENQLSLTTNPTLVHIDDESQNNPATIVASIMDDGDQLNGTRGDVVLIGKSGHPLATNTTVDLALDPVNAKVVADGPQHDARGVDTIECLVDNMTQQSTGGGVELVHESNWAVVTKKKSPSIGIGSPISNTVQQVVDNQTTNSSAREIVPQEVMCFNTFDALTNNFVHEINSSQVNSTNELVISKKKQGATSTLRWIEIADKEEEQVTSPPMQKKLSQTTPAFVPSSAKLVTPLQGLSPSTNVVAILSDRLVSSNIEKLASLAPININKQLQVGGSCTLSPNKFSNLDDEDISEEGEEGEEEEMLDYYFAIAARNADISPSQQRNNKTKHERKHSWDGKVTEEFVPRQLPMRLAKQNHMTISTTSTRFNKAKK